MMDSNSAETMATSNTKPEYTLETLASNSNSSLDSSQLNLDTTDDFMAMNENNLTNCGLGNRDGYTVLSPIFSTPAPSAMGNHPAEYFMNNNPLMYDAQNQELTNNFGNLNMSGYQQNNILVSGPPVNNIFNDDANNFDNKSCCIECGAFAVLQKCKAHCNLDICENCKQKHWQTEMDELLKLKSHLETNVGDLRNYLSAKKAQCSENIRNSQQIKRFINMTMNQIKRKVELELENKRDELYSSVESFCDNQKKLSVSVNEDSFQSAERVCDEIENLLLAADSNVNLIKVNSLKTYARSCTQKLNQQKGSRVPLYSIFFVPDSAIQVNNSFGKIVLKSYNPDGADNLNEQTTTLDDGQTFDESYFMPQQSQTFVNNDQLNIYDQPSAQIQQQQKLQQQQLAQQQLQQQQLQQQQLQQQQLQQQQLHQQQLQQQLAQQQQIMSSRALPNLSFTPKYTPLKDTQKYSPPPSSTISTNNSLFDDSKKPSYQNKYYTQQYTAPKSDNGSFISKRVTNVYANSQPSSQQTQPRLQPQPQIQVQPQLQPAPLIHLQTIPKSQQPTSKIQSKSESPKAEETKPQPKQEVNNQEQKFEPKEPLQPKQKSPESPSVKISYEIKPEIQLPTKYIGNSNNLQTANKPFTFTKPESPSDDHKEDFSFDDKLERDSYSFVSESEDGDLNTTNYTDITISNIKSDDSLKIDRGHFEDVFMRAPIKSHDIKIDVPKPVNLQVNNQKSKLQVPGETNSIREIKVIHTKPVTVNGVKRFNNFQNSTSSSFDKSESFTSSGSESSQTSGSMQKSFKQKLLFSNKSSVGVVKAGNS